MSRLGEFRLIGNERGASVLITAPHAFPPNSDKNTGRIAEQAALMSGATALIAMVSRKKIDLNRGESEKHPFRKKIKEVIRFGRKPFLILDLHGMHTSGKRVEIGTDFGKSAPNWVVELLADTLAKHGVKVSINRKFAGSMKGTITSSYAEPIWHICNTVRTSCFYEGKAPDCQYRKNNL
ncbi:MAG: N-formylglutamate amidohydrolase [Candidatus Micrarchaeia archaeon]